MIYIEKIKVIDQTYPGATALKKNFKFDCDNLNLFVGDQGCGKSTMLKLLQQNHNDLELKLSDYTIEKGVEHFYFDTERDNPRMKDAQHYSTPDGRNKGIGVGGALATYFMSHGEALVLFTVETIAKAKNCILLIDEPESGLSITNQFRLIDSIEIALSNNCQLFIATHCFPLIEKYDVISLEHNKKMSGKSFIDKIKNK